MFGSLISNNHQGLDCLHISDDALRTAAVFLVLIHCRFVIGILCMISDMFPLVILVLSYGITVESSCPRYPNATCAGPFRIRPSQKQIQYSWQTCSAGQWKVMSDCVTDCLNDHCCRAFGLENGVCVTAYFQTEAYHFVKEVMKINKIK